jgi:anaphase-promoting complex subunit 6
MDAPPLAPRVPRATLEKLRSVVRDCLEKHLDDSAVFFADKLVSMSGDGEAKDPDDLFLYCQALFAGKHHRRALTVMRGAGLVDGGDVPARDVPAVRKNAPRFRLLAARCLAATREWDECLAALGDGESSEISEDLRRG